MKVVVTASTFPLRDSDNVPDFVLQQLLALKQHNSDLDFYVHTPYVYRKDMEKEAVPVRPHAEYEVFRYHYFIPRKFQVLAGNGIMPALKANRALYLLVPFFIGAQFSSLLWLCLKRRPDLIYAHWFTPQAISAAFVSKLTGIPFIFTTHASDVSVLKRLPLSHFLVRGICRAAYCYTAVSKKTAGKLKDFFAEEDWGKFEKKLSILPMGVRLPKSVCSSTKEEVFNILFVGRFVEKKGVPVLIQAANLVKEGGEFDFKVVLVGDGSERNHYRNLIEILGLEEFLSLPGYLKGADKDAVFREADVVCIPSINASDGDEEGLPVVLLEALSYGKIVIASFDSGAGDIINDGFNGFLSYSDSPQELADILKRVACMSEYEKNRVRRNAKECSKKFQWEFLSEEYERLILSAINSTR